MMNEQDFQGEEQQKTVLIPVLSLHSANAAAKKMSAKAAESAFRGSSAPAWSPETADSVCDRILRQTEPATTISNPFIEKATKLTTMACVLRSAKAPANFINFSQILIDSIREFDRDLVQTQVRHDAAMVARYVLCCVIDEAVLSTAWGISSGWAHRSLLRLFHNEANGGERFFSLLEHATRHQHECRDLLELFYLCLSLGFEGRLHLDPQGQDKIETLRAQLFRILYAGQPRHSDLSTSWQPQAPAEISPHSRFTWRSISIIASIAVILVIAGMRLWLQVSASEVATSYESTFQSPPAERRQ